jgi:hypothetical protein
LLRSGPNRWGRPARIPDARHRGYSK